jgi:hypothetical protein
VLHADNTLVSGDYPFYLKKAITDEYPNVIPLFAQGTSGNTSTRYFRRSQSFQEAERMGRILGNAAVKAIAQAGWRSQVKLAAISRESTFVYRDLPPLSQAQDNASLLSERVQALTASNASPLEVWNETLKLYGAEDILAYTLLKSRGELPALAVDETEPEIQAF